MHTVRPPTGCPVPPGAPSARPAWIKLCGLCGYFFRHQGQRRGAGRAGAERCSHIRGPLQAGRRKSWRKNHPSLSVSCKCVDYGKKSPESLQCPLSSGPLRSEQRRNHVPHGRCNVKTQGPERPTSGPSLKHSVLVFGCNAPPARKTSVQAQLNIRPRSAWLTQPHWHHVRHINSEVGAAACRTGPAARAWAASLPLPP